MRPGAAIFEPPQAVGPVAADPLVAGRPADSELLGDGHHRPAVDGHPFHEQRSELGDNCGLTVVTDETQLGQTDRSLLTASITVPMVDR